MKPKGPRIAHKNKIWIILVHLNNLLAVLNSVDSNFMSSFSGSANLT